MIIENGKCRFIKSDEIWGNGFPFDLVIWSAMRFTSKLSDKAVDGMIDKIANTMTFLQHEKIPKDLRKCYVLQFRKLLESVQIWNVERKDFRIQFSRIQSELLQSFEDVKIPVMKGENDQLQFRRLTSKEKCDVFLGMYIRFGKAYQPKISSRPARIVDVTDKVVAADQKVFAIGHREQYSLTDHPLIQRMSHHTFLRELTLKNIRVIDEYEEERFSLETEMEKKKSAVQELRRKALPIDVMQLLVAYAHTFSFELHMHETLEDARQRIIGLLQEDIVIHQLRLSELETGVPTS